MAKWPTTLVPKDKYVCRCCGKLPPSFYVDGEVGVEYLMLFSVYEDLCTEMWKPAPITSGYRCPAYNKQVGGESISVHIFGLALDITPKDEDEAKKIVGILKANDLKPRIGWRQYLKEGKRLVHFDLGWLITPKWSASLRQNAEW